MERVPYSSIVDSLMYVLVCTRPNIAHAVGVVSRYTSNPGRKHWNTLKWVMRYLRGTSSLKLSFGSDYPFLFGYTDSDMVGDIDGRKFTSGDIVHRNDKNMQRVTMDEGFTRELDLSEDRLHIVLGLVETFSRKLKQIGKVTALVQHLGQLISQLLCEVDSRIYLGLRVILTAVFSDNSVIPVLFRLRLRLAWNRREYPLSVGCTLSKKKYSERLLHIPCSREDKKHVGPYSSKPVPQHPRSTTLKPATVSRKNYRRINVCIDDSTVDQAGSHGLHRSLEHGVELSCHIGQRINALPAAVSIACICCHDSWYNYGMAETFGAVCRLCSDIIIALFVMYQQSPASRSAVESPNTIIVGGVVLNGGWALAIVNITQRRERIAQRETTKRIANLLPIFPPSSSVAWHDIPISCKLNWQCCFQSLVKLMRILLRAMAGAGDEP
ncbi:Retrovirus-related Pol polyprotein from transposon TNT 1-94-like protein [Drosera capensis]